MAHYCTILVLICGTIYGTLAQLVVNVKNRGEEVLQETINANTTLDSVTLDFLKADGTEIIQYIDMKNVHVYDYIYI